VAVCPDVFWLTDDGYAEAQEGPVATHLQDGVQEAAEACPEHAITAG
jgi:ferredoxin